MPRSHKVPSYRLHKPSGQAVVTIRLARGVRRDVYLGEYNSPDSRREYGRIVAELANTTIPPKVARCPLNEKSISEMLLSFMLGPRLITAH